MRAPRLLAAATCVLTLGLTVGVASAKDVCISVNDSWYYVLKNAKKPRPGGAVALHGMFISMSTSAPVAGTAIMRKDGTVKVGIFVHRIGSGANFTDAVTGDAHFNATGAYDVTGDYHGDKPTTWTRVACDTVTIP
jgi:hypothetical protein